MRMSTQARTTLMLLRGSQDLSRQQVFPRPVNLMEMGSEREKEGRKEKTQVEEKEDTN